MLKKKIFAFAGLLMLAGATPAFAENPQDTKMDVYPSYTVPVYQAQGAEAFASARRTVERTVRSPRGGFSGSEMSLFNRIDPHGF